MTRNALCTVLGLLALGSGCAPDFTQAWEVKDPRVLAARVEIDGDLSKSRTRPRLGEKFSIRHFIATPRKPARPAAERYDFTLELCLGLKLANGLLACGQLDGAPGSLPFQGATMVVNDDEIRVSGLQVPQQLASLPPPFDKIDRIALFGALCVDGKVERVPGKQVNTDPILELFRCIANEGATYTDPLIFSQSVLIDLGREGDDNHHPSFACSAAEGATDACRAGVKVPGEQTVPGEFVLVRPESASPTRSTLAWPAFAGADLPWDSCATSGLPQVRVGEDEYTIRGRFDAQDRESFEFDAMEYGKTVRKRDREELIVAHALTDLGGDLARYFSVIENSVSDAEAEFELGYTPPASDDEEASKGLTSAGRLVRFYFVARDERGGVDYTTRELCLMPAGKE